MVRALIGAAALGLAAACVVPAGYGGYGGYGGIILLPNGSVNLPREDSLMACAAAVRAGAAAPDPLQLGAFQAVLPGGGRKPEGALGLCQGGDGLIHMIFQDEIREGSRVIIAP